MSIFQTSKSSGLGPGIYGISVKPPLVVKAEGTGVTCLVEQFPWGPSQVVFDPSDIGDLILTYFPPGMSRLGPGALAVGGKGWPDPRIIRVAGSTAALAAATVEDGSAVNLFTATLKFPGTAGNAAVITVAAASDGNSNHRDVSVSVTGATGTTTDTIRNFNISGTGADYLGADVISQCRLLGSITKLAAGLPALGTTAFAGGTDGTVAAADYVGTSGTGDKGLAATEGHEEINFICFGDPGNGGSTRATCNAGLKAHADLMGSRIAFMTGNSGQAASAAQTDVGSYRSAFVGYVDPFMKKISDQDGSIQTVPAAAMAMSVAAQLSPSTHVSWRDPEVAALMDDVYDVESVRGNQSKSNTDAGIITLIKKKRGGFAFFMDPNTNAPVNPAQSSLADSRMAQYVLISAIDSLESVVNGPNVPATQQPIRDALTAFMEELVHNRDHDPSHNPYVKSYSIEPAVSVNPQAELDAGDYSIPIKMKTDAGMIRVFIPIQYGPTVSP